MIERREHRRIIERLISNSPVVCILGARQVGKTTLAKQVAGQRSGPTHFFDLESSADRARLSDPLLALSKLRGLVVLDEIQRLPEVFPTLRVLADRSRRVARFLVLGSASPELLQQSSETLAGRIAYHELPGFSLGEVTASRLRRLWLRGGFPRAYTIPGHASSFRWRVNFVRTFLERDVPQLDIRVSASTLDRFWTMLAHYHAQTWNGSELGRAFGVSHHTVRRYLDALESTFMVRGLQPWHANPKKRQVKSPKIYVRDSGLLHRLLNVATFDELQRHPKVGASWEGFIIETLLNTLGVDGRECFFWATHAGGEIDLIVPSGGQWRGFEIKHTSAPKATRSMHTALAELPLASVDVIHAGDQTYPLAPRIRAVAAERLLEDL